MVENTQRMKDICEFIIDYQFEHQFTPSMDEIAEAVGTVKSNIFKYLAKMEQRGMISRHKRDIEVHTSVRNTPEFNRVPVLGSIACGEPEYTEENFEEYVPLPVALFGKGDFFILRTHGLSMIDVGITPGDMVIVRKQNIANEGDIIVALVGSETTLKRYYIDKENHCVRLHPENKNMEDILTRDCRIQGVAQHIIKAI